MCNGFFARDLLISLVCLSNDTFKFPSLYVKPSKIYVLDELRLVIKAMSLGGSNIYFTRTILQALFLSLFRKNIIYEVHNYGPNKLWHFLLRLLPKKTKVLSVNKGVHNKLCVDGFAPMMLYNGYNSTINPKEDLREKYSILGRLIIYSGSFYANRGLDLVIKLAEKHPEDTFVLIGGKLDYNLDNIICLGRIMQEYVLGYLIQADLLLSPYT